MEAPFSPDPRNVRVTFGDAVTDGDGRVLSATVEDGTEAESCEIGCRVTGSAWSVRSVDEMEKAVARHLNLIPAEHRIAAVRAFGELGGRYEVSLLSEGEVAVTDSLIPVVS